jgi:hypothetical protein
MIAAYLSESAFWGSSIDSPALRKAVAVDFAALTAKALTITSLGELIAAR